MDRACPSVAIGPHRVLQRQSLQAHDKGASGNYYDVESGEEYWISGVKKSGQDRHWAGGGKITIEAAAVDEYLEVVGAEELDSSRFVVSHDITPSAPAKFHEIENQPLSSPDS